MIIMAWYNDILTRSKNYVIIMMQAIDASLNVSIVLPLSIDKGI